MDWEQIIVIVLGSSLVATVVAKIFDLVVEGKRKVEEQYQKLYGPLRYQLLVMKILEENKKDLMEEIKNEYDNPALRTESFRKDVNPLTVKWISCKNDIRKLFENYSGYIKKTDILLVKDFLDGCIKREITEEGKNQWMSEDRVEKLLSAIKTLQDKLL